MYGLLYRLTSRVDIGTLFLGYGGPAGAVRFGEPPGCAALTGTHVHSGSLTVRYSPRIHAINWCP